MVFIAIITPSNKYRIKRKKCFVFIDLSTHFPRFSYSLLMECVIFANEVEVINPTDPFHNDIKSLLKDVGIHFPSREQFNKNFPIHSHYPWQLMQSLVHIMLELYQSLHTRDTKRAKECQPTKMLSFFFDSLWNYRVLCEEFFHNPSKLKIYFPCIILSSIHITFSVLYISP